MREKWPIKFLRQLRYGPCFVLGGEDEVHAHQWLGTLPVSGEHGNHRSLTKKFEPVKWLALSPTGTRAAIVTTEGLAVWDVAQAKRLRLISGIDGPVAFSPDGRHLVAGKKSELEWYDAPGSR